MRFLLCRHSLLSPTAFGEGSRLFAEFIGALSGSYILQALFEKPPAWTTTSPCRRFRYIEVITLRDKQRKQGPAAVVLSDPGTTRPRRPPVGNSHPVQIRSPESPARFRQTIAEAVKYCKDNQILQPFLAKQSTVRMQGGHISPKSTSVSLSSGAAQTLSLNPDFEKSM